MYMKHGHWWQAIEYDTTNRIENNGEGYPILDGFWDNVSYADNDNDDDNSNGDVFNTATSSDLICSACQRNFKWLSLILSFSLCPSFVVLTWCQIHFVKKNHRIRRRTVARRPTHKQIVVLVAYLKWMLTISLRYLE